MRIGNQFIDPTTGETWTWPINQNDETGAASKAGGQGGVARNLTISAPTSGGPHIRQEGAPDPLSFSWKGTALTRLQHQKFLYWFAKCDHHSIILQDFSGDRFEVFITAYIPVRKPVVQNRNDMTNAPLWIYDYQIDLDVIAAIAGDYFNAGVRVG